MPFAANATLFGLSVASACAASAWTGDLREPERWEYSEIADNILNGRGPFADFLGTRYYLYGSWLYPRLLAGILWITDGNEWPVVVLQALLAAATTLTIAALGNAMFGPVKGVVAGVLAAFHPGAVIYVGKLHSQVLDALLIALTFLILLRLGTAPRARTAALAGIVAGIAATSRGTIIPFLALYAVWLAVIGRREWRHTVGILACAGVFGAIALSIPMAEGYLRYGTIVPLRTDTGVNLWIGNHPGASGTSFTNDATPAPLLTRMPEALAVQIAQGDASSQNKVFTAHVIDFVRTEPAGFASLFVRKLWYFWWRSPHVGLLYPRSWAATYFLYYSAVAAAAFVLLVISLRRAQAAARHGAQLFLLLAFSFSTTQALFYVEGRHRWQIELLLLTFTAAAVVEASQAIRRAGARRGTRPSATRA